MRQHNIIWSDAPTVTPNLSTALIQAQHAVVIYARDTQRDCELIALKIRHTDHLADELSGKDLGKRSALTGNLIYWIACNLESIQQRIARASEDSSSYEAAILEAIQDHAEAGR